MINESVLTESATMRASFAERVSVLDKVGVLAMLPDGVHVTRDGVAQFYGVPAETVRSLAADHRTELESNGMYVVAGQEFRGMFPHNPKGGRPSAQIYTRRTVLNVGMLLRDSEVAKQVRSYLLNVEEAAPTEDREAAVQRLLQKRQYKEVVRDSLKAIGTEPGWQYGEIHNVLLTAITGIKAPALLDAGREIQTWKGVTPTKADKAVATNFLFADELELFNLITDAVAVDLRFRKPRTYREFLVVVHDAADRYTS